MEITQFLAQLLAILEEQGIAYAIGGSVASSHYGELRTTLDVDLSVQIAENAIAPLTAAWQAQEWYVPNEQMRQAVTQGGTFSINDGVWKADFFVIEEADTFAREAFARRQRHAYSLTGQEAWFLTPEDVIIHKLRWCEGKWLDKHVRDIKAILTLEYDHLDLDRITHWANELQAGTLWLGILDSFRRTDGDTPQSK